MELILLAAPAILAALVIAIYMLTSVDVDSDDEWDGGPEDF